MSRTPASPRVRAWLLVAAAAAALLALFAWMGFTTPVVASPVEETPGSLGLSSNSPDAADIRLDKVGPGSAYPGDTIVYFLDVRNAGTTTTSLVLTDTLPNNANWLGTQAASAVSCNVPSGTNIICTIASLPPSAAAFLRAVTITVGIPTSAAPGTTVVNVAQAKSPDDPGGLKSDLVVTNIIAAPTSTPTPTGGAPVPDAAECNNDFDHAYRISAGQTVPTLNFVPPPPGSCGSLPIGATDIDYFVVRAKAGDWYEALTKELSPGIDTYMRLYDQNRNLVAENDDSAPGTFASRIAWQSPYDGDYYVQITNLDPNNPRGATYKLEVKALTSIPTPQPTNTQVPGPTPIPGLDACELNYDFDHACTIAPGAALSNMNFISAAPGQPDNDFYRLWQKPGLNYTCETDNLAAGMDTNIIVYDANRNGVMGNDDCTPGAFRSCVSWTSNYTGWVYFLVGSVVQPPPSPSTYDFECNVAGPTATPTPVPTNTPGLPPTVWFPSPPPPTSFIPPPATGIAPTLPPPATATQAMGAIPLPTPTRAVSAQVIRVDVRIYYDANGNSAPDSGEGILAMRAQLVDAAGNVLDSRLTGATGQVSLTALSTGDVYLEVPYLGVRVAVAGPRTGVDVRIVAQSLPGSIP